MCSLKRKVDTEIIVDGKKKNNELSEVKNTFTAKKYETKSTQTTAIFASSKKHPAWIKSDNITIIGEGEKDGIHFCTLFGLSVTTIKTKFYLPFFI